MGDKVKRKAKEASIGGKTKSTPVSNFHFHFSTIAFSELTLQSSKKRMAKSLCVTCMFCHNVHFTLPCSVLLKKKSVEILTNINIVTLVTQGFAIFCPLPFHFVRRGTLGFTVLWY